MKKIDYTKYSNEELIAEITEIKKRKKYGLVWDEERELEEVVTQCKKELPVLKEVKNKAIINDPDKPTHILIEGDNYHALSVLNYTHNNSKVDMNRNMIANPIYSGLTKIDTMYEKIQETKPVTKPSLLNYSWYRSSLEDLECKNLLQHKGQGAFIVSNYFGEVNNYFLIIKNDNRLVKQDIVYNKHGFSLYGVINAPSFISLPELVEHYSTPRREFTFKLIDGLPDYDNAHLKSSTIKYSPHIRRNRYGIDGPLLPIKNKNK